MIKVVIVWGALVAPEGSQSLRGGRMRRTDKSSSDGY
jgi:hypothetical protein